MQKIYPQKNLLLRTGSDNDAIGDDYPVDEQKFHIKIIYILVSVKKALYFEVLIFHISFLKPEMIFSGFFLKFYVLFSHIEDVEIFQNKEDKSMEKY